MFECILILPVIYVFMLDCYKLTLVHILYMCFNDNKVSGTMDVWSLFVCLVCPAKQFIHAIQLYKPGFEVFGLW